MKAKTERAVVIDPPQETGRRWNATRQVDFWGKRPIPLKNLRHVASELARLYRGLQSRQVDPADAGRFAFVLDRCKSVLEAVEARQTFGDRLDRLEAALTGPQADGGPLLAEPAPEAAVLPAPADPEGSAS